MGATATLSTSDLAVAPGGDVTCQVMVRNAGELVDQFTVDVVGDAASWSHAEPPVVNLNPGESAPVLIRFAPPRDAGVYAGAVPFGVRVISREDPHGSVVEEGVVTVGAFTDVAAELVPAKAEGGRKAKYEVAVDNVGNAPALLRLRAVDPEDELDFRLDRSEISLPPGTTAFVRLQAKPRRTFLRGEPKRHPFQVEITPEQGDPLLAQGTMVQRQLLPKWLLPAVIALLLLAGALAALWFSVLKPAVKSAAREAMQQESAEIKQKSEDAAGAAGAAKEESKKAAANAEQALGALGLKPGDTSGTPTLPKPAEKGEPVTFRIDVTAPIVANTGSFTEISFTPPDDKKTVLIKDIFFENAKGDTGTAQLVRDANGTRTVIRVIGLGNFRDRDEHVQEPLRFQPGEKIVFRVSCQNPQPKGACTPSVVLNGRAE
ncbi:COG1470 family protein [Lentzea flava]|uniref:Hydrolytic protein n=1 Tax=Lentzea flava TaxID=103732 RepID=A0ABQ2UW08_9PSEU|nr:hypothetical protein [Lentzea flava]MCP2202074.1 hypothetical protein [Lentzea flava]GGU56840.1 hypothetical protein GCM10010178_56470 [Lentzea flava]